jgi:hypothetical protein
MRAAVILAVVCAAASVAGAHGLRSAYLEVDELEPGRALVQLTKSVPGAALEVRAEPPCVLAPMGATRVLACPGGMAGRTLVLEGLGPVISDAVVYVALADGTTATHLVKADEPRVVLAPAAPSSEPSAGTVAREFVGLGLVHIFTGFDHLLFLLLIVLWLRDPRAVLLAETAFTLSHSLSFTATALGWIQVPQAAAEACIALSLLLLATDRDLRPGGQTVSRWRGARLALVFGCVHGLGFASGLRELGIPEHAIGSALLGFAGGVELGQVAFLAAVLVAFRLARDAAWRTRAELAGLYAIGSFSAYLVLERTIAL